MATTAKTNANANVINAVITDVYVSNTNCVKIAIDAEVLQYLNDEMVASHKITVTPKELINMFRNTPELEEDFAKGLSADIFEAGGDVIKLRNRNPKTKPRVNLAVSPLLIGATISFTLVDVPAFGTFTNSAGETENNPTTYNSGGEDYSHNINVALLHSCTIRDDDDWWKNYNVVKNRYDYWTQYLLHKDNVVFDRQIERRTKTKSLGDKIQEKVNEED